MKKNIKYVLLFLLPIIIIGVSLEILLRNIPNNYQYKKEFLDKYSDSIRVLFLGSSGAFYGIDPAYCSPKSYNASQVSQSLDYDLETLKKYRNNWSNLKCIAIPINYISLFDKLESGIEAWRVKNYCIYYGMHRSGKLKNYTEVFSSKLDVNLKRLYSYYIEKKPNITCTYLGWGFKNQSRYKQDLEQTGKTTAEGILLRIINSLKKI
jgi:hypothetical protein